MSLEYILVLTDMEVKRSYRVFILSGAGSSDAKGYLYATFLQHLTVLNVIEADIDEQQNIFIIK